MLTEILLEVTSQEIEDIVNEVVEDAKSRSPPPPLPYSHVYCLISQAMVC